MASGLLGQTFDVDDVARNGQRRSREGAIEGSISDYESTSLDPVRDGEVPGAEPGTDSECQELIELIEKTLEKLLEALDQLKAGDAAQAVDSTVTAMESNTETGSGDDVVEIITGGKQNVELGSGDDKVFVDFKDATGSSSATIAGGSGDDTVTLVGSESDYTVSQTDGFTVYTDLSGNAVKVAEDVEKVRFETETT